MFISSIYGQVPAPTMVDYNSSKAALNMMAKIIAKEEGSKYVSLSLLKIPLIIY